MTRDDAVRLASDWLFTRGIEFGSCRYASFKWGFSRDEALSGGMRLLPSPFGWRSGPDGDARELCEGWLVVFNPAEGEAQRRDQCVVVWIGETQPEIRQQRSA